MILIMKDSTIGASLTTQVIIIIYEVSVVLRPYVPQSRLYGSSQRLIEPDDQNLQAYCNIVLTSPNLPRAEKRAIDLVASLIEMPE